ncbi:MAG: CDP-glycerol glycerophosphotransferase family protein [Cycloclasticus sp.]
MLVIFDTANVYYLPQFQPIIRVLLANGHEVKLACYANNISETYKGVLADIGVDISWVNDESSASDLYLKLKPDWILFGNSFKYLDELHNKGIDTAQLGHGVGPKPSYYHKSSTPMSVRFIEGSGRLEKIKMLYPFDKFIQVGFSKLDPMFNGKEKGLDYKKLGLDINKPSILYAPTFNPSSLERFPDDWPKDFVNYNILIKPHTFTYTIESYTNQRAKLKKWALFPNVYVASPLDLSLLPFMKNADILLSEASSTLFEFAALGKPVVVCDFFKIKWSYRGPLRYRFIKRFGKDNVLYKNIGQHVKSYNELLRSVPQQLNNISEYKQRRLNYTKEHVGSTDGKSSQRIVEYLENMKNT